MKWGFFFKKSPHFCFYAFVACSNLSGDRSWIKRKTCESNGSENKICNVKLTTQNPVNHAYC